MRLTAQTVVDLLAAFRAPTPAPGGGSAAALTGAMGASLLAMVAALPRSRAEGPQQAELSAAGAACTSIAERLTMLVDRDTEAYTLVMNAFKLPKDTPEDKAARSARIQEATRGATEAPLDVMRACAEALRHARPVAAFGNPNASSDVQVAIELLAAALRGARFNVGINLDSLKDVDYVARATEESALLVSQAEAAAASARGAL